MRRPSSFAPILALAALGASALALSCSQEHHVDHAGIFILGVDGMDPVILQRLMDQGKAPNFKKLAADGGFENLGTSNPPQSPVAWSNFVTGMDPGGHGIYDFVHRDPKTYLPISSATPPPGDPGTSVKVGGYYLPIIAGDDILNNRSGTPCRAQSRPDAASGPSARTLARGGTRQSDNPSRLGPAGPLR